jgi:hypothetical protein
MKEKKLISPLGWILIILFILLSFYAPYFVAKVWWPQYEFKETGQIGDTIGGIAGPLISALSAILVFIAFKEQVKANKLVQAHFTIAGIYEELKILEHHTDKLEEKLYFSEYDEKTLKWIRIEPEINYSTIRSWIYRMQLAEIILENAHIAKDDKLMRRVGTFTEYRLKPLIRHMNEFIPQETHSLMKAQWNSRFDEFMNLKIDRNLL